MRPSLRASRPWQRGRWRSDSRRGASTADAGAAQSVADSLSSSGRGRHGDPGDGAAREGRRSSTGCTPTRIAAGTAYGPEAAEALGLEPARVFKTLVAEVDGTLTVGVVPVSATLDLKALAAAVGGKRARMADVAAAERATGYVAGGISPLGQRKRLPTVRRRDRREALPTMFCSGGRRGLEVELAPDGPRPPHRGDVRPDRRLTRYPRLCRRDLRGRSRLSVPQRHGEWCFRDPRREPDHGRRGRHPRRAGPHADPHVGHPRDGAAAAPAGSRPRRVPAVGPRVRPQGARGVVGRVMALQVVARRPRSAAPAQLRRHGAGRRPRGRARLDGARGGPPGAAAAAGRARDLPRGDPARRDQPPDQRPGPHRVEPHARAALPRHGGDPRGCRARMVDLRVRPGPAAGAGGAVAVRAGERVVPGAAAGVRRARRRRLGPRGARGRADPPAVRRGPDRQADRPRGRAPLRPAHAGVGLPRLAARRRRAWCWCWPGG